MLSNRIRPDVEAAPWVIEEIKHLEQQLASLTKGVKIQIPSNTLEQEFSSWHRRGYNKAKEEMQKEIERLKAELELYAAEMSAAKENGFYSTQELLMAYQNAEEELAEAKKDAERWKYARRKICFTGNGDGTCMMHGINLPAAIPGWPDPGKVAEFCDAAIDAAMKGK